MTQLILFEKMKKIFDRPLGRSMIFFVFLFILFASIFTISHGDPVPDDAYFHFRFAELLRTEGWSAVENFDWIYLTGIAENGGRYTVNLYHVFLIPFTFFSDQLLGLHFAIAFCMSLIGAIAYYVLCKEKVRYPLFFAVLIFSSVYFMERFLLGRSLVLMTSLVFLEMLFAIRRKYISLFLIVLLHVLWHQTTYFIPLIIVFIVETARYLATFRFAFMAIVSTIGSVVVGMMFFPGFPMSLFGWMKNIINIQTGDAAGATSGSLGGAELIVKDFMTYFVGQNTLFLLFVIGIVGSVFFYIAQKRSGIALKNLPENRMIWIYTLFLFLLFVTLGSSVISGRFYDFVLLAIVMSVAFTVTAFIELDIIQVKPIFRPWIAAIFTIWLGVIFVHSLTYVYVRANSYDNTPALRAAEWISSHSDERAKIYVHNWGNFNLMFFGNTKDTYSTGIEPTSLRDYDPVLFWKYYNIFAHNYYCELQKDCRDEFQQIMKQLGGMDEATREMYMKSNARNVVMSIKNDFKADFIVSDSKNFDEVVQANPEFIDQFFEVSSEKYDGLHMHFTVYKLK